MLPTLRRLAQQVAGAVPSQAKLQQVVKLRSEIFGTTYNPESLRTGSKVLKARLRGPAMLRYYGERFTGVERTRTSDSGITTERHLRGD